MRKISFVIPCYHSAQTVGNVVRDIVDTVLVRSEFQYEIILVNDNPPDDTWRVICEMCRNNPNIHGICFTKNFGQHAALMAGYRKVTGDIVVSLDDDGQNPPQEMFKLIDALNEKTDLAYAKYIQKKCSFFRNFGSKVNDWMVQWLLNKPKELYLASYYAAKRFIIDEMVKCENPFPYIDGLALRSTSEYINVDIVHKERVAGNSGYSVAKLLGLWMNGLTSFSVKPLRIATFSGFCISLFGLVLAIIIIIQKLILKDAVSAGWPSIMTVVLILDGAIMIMLGLVGEYVGRIYITMNKSPQYVIKDEVNPIDTE
ncbi:MAG: glycosyltransferase family 2 protein [Clostridia bacterium]|nr:glycosyltransferase family 2 protein [Clostridia bacterium]